MSSRHSRRGGRGLNNISVDDEFSTPNHSMGEFSEEMVPSDDDESSPGGGNDKDDEEESIEGQVLAKREQRTVCGLRLLFILVLILCTGTVAYLTYYFTTKWETEQFEVQFKEDSHKVLQSIGITLALTLQGLDGLMVSLVSSAKETQQVRFFPGRA